MQPAYKPLGEASVSTKKQRLLSDFFAPPPQAPVPVHAPAPAPTPAPLPPLPDDDLEPSEYDDDEDEGHGLAHPRLPAPALLPPLPEEELEPSEDEGGGEDRAVAAEPQCPTDLPWVASDYELIPARPGERIFDDDEPDEVWRALPWRKPAEDLLASNYGYYRARGRLRRGFYGKKTRGCLAPQGRYYFNGAQVSILVCEAFRGRKPTPSHTCDHFNCYQRDNNHIDNLWWRTHSQQVRNRRPPGTKRTAQPIDARKKGTDEWVPYVSKGGASNATGVAMGTITTVLVGKAGAGSMIDYEFRVGAPPESQQEVLPPDANDPEEERWAFARMRNGEESPRHRVSTRGRAQTKTAIGEVWSLIYTPKPREGHVYASFVVGGVDDLFHAVVWRTFRPDEPIDYANTGSIDHKNRDPTNNALYNLQPSTPSEQSLNQDRKDRALVFESRKQDVWGLPAGAPADVPREWLGPSTHEAAEALTQRIGVSVTQSSVSSSIQSGGLSRGWRFFATPDAATDARRAAEHARVVAALDAMEARVAAAAADADANADSDSDALPSPPPPPCLNADDGEESDEDAGWGV